MISHTLPPGVEPVLPPAVLSTAPARAYLRALDFSVPGLDLHADRAVAIGYLAAREIRAGRWDEHRALAALTFDEDEFDTLALAAVAILDPGPVPEPFATWIETARVAASAGLPSEAAAERLAEVTA